MTSQQPILSKVEALEWARIQDVRLPTPYHGYKLEEARHAALTIGRMAAMDQVQSIFDQIDLAEDKGISFQHWQKQLQEGRFSTEIPRVFLEITLLAYLQVWYQNGRCWALTLREKESRRALPLQYLAVNGCANNPGHARFHQKTRGSGDPWWRRNFPPNALGCHCVVIVAGDAEIAGEQGDAADPGWDFFVCENSPMAAIQRDIQSRLSQCDEPLPGPLPPLRLPDIADFSLPNPAVVKQWSQPQQSVHGIVTSLAERLESPLPPEHLLKSCIGAKDRKELESQLVNLMTPLFSSAGESFIAERFASLLEDGLFTASVFGYVTAYRNEY